MLFSNANKTIGLIDNFFNCVDKSILLFQEGVKSYLYKNGGGFKNKLQELASVEIESDQLRRKIENILYTQSLMPQLRSDILRLLEEMDKLIDHSKKTLFQFDVESPLIPDDLIPELIKLTQISLSAAESVIPAAKSYFNEPALVSEKIHRVFFYEKEADVFADVVRRKIFKEMNMLKLSEKFHLRYFTLHIENISDTAEKVADLLTVMAIKRIV